MNPSRFHTDFLTAARAQTAALTQPEQPYKQAAQSPSLILCSPKKMKGSTVLDPSLQAFLAHLGFHFFLFRIKYCWRIMNSKHTLHKGFIFVCLCFVSQPDSAVRNCHRRWGRVAAPVTRRSLEMLRNTEVHRETITWLWQAATVVTVLAQRFSKSQLWGYNPRV